MHLFSTYRNHVIAIIDGLKAEGAIPAEASHAAVTLEPPRDASHGDMSTNAAMVLAGQAKQNPRALAEKIAQKLKNVEGITAVSVAGPGFINLTLSPEIWRDVIPEIIHEGTAYGDSDFGGKKRIDVEYVSANPTGPLHIGHARGAVYGDALARLLEKAGFDVTKEYYINDAGSQVDVLARSAYLRYREVCGENIGEIPAGLYPGDYLIEAGQAIHYAHGKDLLGKDESEWLVPVRTIAINAMMNLVRRDLVDLGITHDVFTSERALKDGGKVEEAVEILTKLGHVYNGVLEPPKGETPDDWEAKEQLLFRSTTFGDDMDRTIAKSDGNFTYFAGDLALTRDKIARGFDELVLMLGADHGGYVKRMEAITLALSESRVTMDVKLCQLVHLFKNGEPMRMSKRAGNFITVRDVLNEVGRDILRFVMLMRKTTQDMEFDLDKVKEQSKDNPVFYVQYAHARAYSLLRLATTEVPSAVEASANPSAKLLSLLTHEAELGVIKKLASFPRAIEQAAAAREPHRIIYFAQELAAMFHELWSIGHGETAIRFVQADKPELTGARLALARGVAGVIASALHVCGVTPVEEL